MVGENKKDKLESALDKTLDKFLHRVKFDEKNGEEKDEALNITLTDNTYPLTPQEEKKIRDLAEEKGIDPEQLIQKAINDFLSRETKPLSKDVIKQEFAFWQELLQKAREGKEETDLNSQEIRVLLSYFRQLARGFWEKD